MLWPMAAEDLEAAPVGRAASPSTSNGKSQGDNLSSRASTAALFFIAGMCFLVLVEQLSTVACNDSCPSWFACLVLAQLLWPLAWAAIGFAAPSRRRIIWFMTTAAAASVIAYAIHLQTATYAAQSISG